MEKFTPEVTKNIGKEQSDSSTFNLAKVFLWMTLGLVITGVVTFALPDLLIWMNNTFSWSEDTLGTVYIALIVVSVIMMLPSVILMNLKAWRPKSVWMIIGYVVYALSMGVLLSSVMLSVFASSDSPSSFVSTVATSFFISAAAFLIMGLIGMFTKKNLGILLPFILTLFLGIGVISLINFFLRSPMLYWITDSVVFGLILLITAVDINRVKKVATSGGFSSSNNLAIYCAYTLYVDFIDIFLRVLYYVLIAKNRNK